MKKQPYYKAKITAFALATALFWACSEKKQNGYSITGTVEGMAQNDTIFLESIKNMETTIVAKTVVKDGRFSFEGVQDTVALRYLSGLTKDDAFSVPFFLENGEISVKIAPQNEAVTGTATNDIFQPIRSKRNEMLQKMNQIEENSSYSDEQKNDLFDQEEAIYEKFLREQMEKNMTNIVGIFLFKDKYFENSLAENQLLFKKIPAEIVKSDSELQAMREQMVSQEKTQANQPFIDFTMQTPENQSVKLSDFVGKGKVVLVDFWASWCGPCRQAMPELKEIHAKYGKKLEIVGVSFDEKEEAWKNAIKNLGLPWKQISDLKGWKSQAAILYGINAIPHTLLIDNQGVIIGRDLHGNALEEKLAEILK